MAFPWAALISAGAQIGGGLLSNWQNQNAEDKAYERQKEMMKMQNDYNLEMWQKNNEYNTPENQLARLLAAGYTNSGAISSINSNASNAPTSGNGGAVNMAPRTLGDRIAQAGNDAINSLKTKAEIKNVEADTKNKNANTETINQSRQLELDKIKAETDKFAAEIGLIGKEKEQYDILLKYLDQKSQADIDLILENKKKITQEIENLSEDKKRIVWENLYRDDFGIDPNSDIMKQLVTASLSGKAEPIWNALEKTSDYVFNKIDNFIIKHKPEVSEFKDALGNNFTSTMFGNISPWEAAHPMLAFTSRGLKYGSNAIKNGFNNIGKDIQYLKNNFIIKKNKPNRNSKYTWD